MSWMVSRNKLDDDQKRAIDLVLTDGNYFVKGEAGTGKSIVLAHAALLYKHTNPDATMCVLTYTNALVACLNEGLEGYGIECMTFHKFMRLRTSSRYNLVLIDEAQDLQPEWAERILAKGDKFVLFGDFAQSIYGFESRLVSEDELMSIFTVRAVALLNRDYRLPKNVRNLVTTIYAEREFHAMPWRLMGNAQIPLFHADDWDSEIAFVVEKAKSYADTGSPTAILFEQKKAIFRFFHTLLEGKIKNKLKLEEVNDLLEKNGLPFRFLGGKVGDFKEGDKRPLTYVMTWHSSKGLDFDTVILPDLGRSPCRCNPLYVALTRSRRNLLLTYSGDQNDQIEKARQCKSVVLVGADASGRVGVRPKGPEQGFLF